MRVTNKRKNSGLTALEVLIGMAVLVLLLSFIAPRLKDDPAKNELQVTAEEFAFQIEMARHAARRLNSEIQVNFNNEKRSNHHSITYKLPGEPNLESVRREFQLPERIRIESPETGVLFDGSGNVRSATPVELVSAARTGLSERFLIE